MITTKITLPEELYAQLKRQYGNANAAPDEVIREALNRLASNDRVATQNRTLDKLASVNLAGGPPDLASNIDDYLYGKDD